MALDAGVDAGRSIRLALQSTRNAYYTRHDAEVQGVIARGGQFHEALERTGAFSTDFLAALQNAELSGTESESLTRMSDEYQRQAQAATTTLTVISTIVIWALVIALLVFMIFYLVINLYLKPYQEAYDMIRNP
jgi:type II secretory pathway component PulF